VPYVTLNGQPVNYSEINGVRVYERPLANSEKAELLNRLIKYSLDAAEDTKTSPRETLQAFAEDMRHEGLRPDSDMRHEPTPPNAGGFGNLPSINQTESPSTRSEETTERTVTLTVEQAEFCYYAIRELPTPITRDSNRETLQRGTLEALQKVEVKLARTRESKLRELADLAMTICDCAKDLEGVERCTCYACLMERDSYREALLKRVKNALGKG